MWFKCLLYFGLTSLIGCEKSFTVVLDTTKSMLEEIVTIKVNLQSIVNMSGSDISNYILVPFNDPDVGTPIIVPTLPQFLTAVNAITVSGGQKCPENSLAGIEKALQISKPKSTIFMFTDAYAKDVSKLQSVETLCRSTRSQVMIFLSGFCSPELSPGVTDQVYYDVAKACSGSVLLLDTASLRQAFTFMKEVINETWTDIITYETFTENKQLTFSVDSFTKTWLLVVSGDNPRVDLTIPNTNQSVDKILDTRTTQVLRLSEPSAGEYTISVRCRNKTSATLYKRYELPLRFGFSTKTPRSMNETSTQPMPGRPNKILIDASQSKMKLEAIHLQVTNEVEKKVLELKENPSDLYLTEAFVGSDQEFRLWIKGYDLDTLKEIVVSSQSFVPQQVAVMDTTWIKPESQILDTEVKTIEFGFNATFACKVTGYPAPEVSWVNEEGETLPSETILLEVPSLYISYVTIENVTANSTIYCKSKNSEGDDSQSINFNVHRPYTFEVLQTPEDQTIEYGGEGKLFCQVSAYPVAETKWYHNDTIVTSSDEIQVDSETNALWIKNMTLNTYGEYKCELKNEVNEKTFTAFVNISGIEAPQVAVDTTNVVLKLGDWSYLECRIIKGKPSPMITWTFRSEDGYEFASLPDGVVADDGKLKIATAQPNHKGVYRCEASNVEGHHSADITVQLQYPPTITNGDQHTLTVKEEDDVVLPCKVDASPPATVRWEMSQDDVIISLDDRHRTDHRYTHRFKALWKDSGNYHCIAENSIGRAEKTITVNVLVAPYIEAPKEKTVLARTGGNLVLTCNVLFGNPVPSTKWEFIATDSSTKILLRGNSSSLLHLNNVSYKNEGSYLCIADNTVGNDSINIYVKIQ
ncbi:hemicentin-1-like [Spodoptera frugiperda]|uniref:Hemicentin-1-like n=1 Tax=Spodoptera frugiperda TaxID=7108 RepID=A0A9R0EUV9_SPOFR|nr:hemicentin-1-like [Spodoptera frugiperda]